MFLQVILAGLAALGPAAEALRLAAPPSDAPPRVVVELHPATTGGPEALLQLLIACADAGADCHWTGDMPIEFELDYREALVERGLQPKYLNRTDFREDDVVIAPESSWCKDFDTGRLYIYLLAEKNMGPDGCRRLSHNHRIAKQANLSRALTLVPYISPVTVEHARREAGLLENGSFANLSELAARKEDCTILMDNDARRLAAVLHGCEVVTAEGFTREELFEVMLGAKVVVDTCMRGTERLPLEAGLHGAVVITDRCKTGDDDEDFPIALRHKKAVDHAVKVAVENWESEVQDPGQVALRKMYGHDVGRESMAEDFRRFLASLPA